MRIKGLLLTVSLIVVISVPGYSRMRSRMSHLELGMDRAQVVQKLGRPDGGRVLGSFESMEYNHRTITAWTNDRADFHVILKDGRVVEYGMGEVRTNDNQALFIIPLEAGK